MRIVQLKIKPEAAVAFQRFYDHRVAPALLKEEGCVFARLIRATESDSDFISFTLCKSAEAASEYEDSGNYQALLKQNTPFQQASNEWKIQLTEDNTLEYRPVVYEPDVKSMPIVAGTNEEDAPNKLSTETYIRILNAQVNPDRFDDLREVYDEEITPALIQIDGCQAAYLIGMPDKNEGLSITIWDSEQKASEYESSGTFDKLMQKVAPFLSSFYQWKMTLDPSKRARTHVSDGLSIKGYKVVSGDDSQVVAANLKTSRSHPIPSAHDSPTELVFYVMQLVASDSMSLKIASFLRNAGVPATPESNLSVLVNYFENQYGLNVMAFLETEWLNEQLNRDHPSNDLMHLWKLILPDLKKAFHEDLEAFKTSR